MYDLKIGKRNQMPRSYIGVAYLPERETYFFDPALFLPDFFAPAFFGADLRPDFVPADFLVPALLPVLFLGAAFLRPRAPGPVLRVEDFFAADFLPGDFLPPDFFAADFFGGTFAPSFLASEMPIAIACLRLVTFLPLPDFNLPFFFSCITSPTFSCAFFEYFAIKQGFNE
jgi:hypothetical protein